METFTTIQVQTAIIQQLTHPQGASRIISAIMMVPFFNTGCAVASDAGSAISRLLRKFFRGLQLLSLSHDSVQEPKQHAKTKAGVCYGSCNKTTHIGRIDVDVAAVKGKVTISFANGTAAALPVVEFDGAPRKF